MKVIIVGAGDVGYVAAETICDSHDVLIIESDADKADIVKNRLNVSVLHENGTNPRTLEYAINTHQAELIISTLPRDDSNIFIGMVAKSIKPSIVTVASITNPDYVQDNGEHNYSGLDVIISPELITAEKMYRLCIMENAIDYEKINFFNSAVAIFEVSPNSKLIGKIVMNSFNASSCSVFGVYRGDELYFQSDTMEMHAGDKICMIGPNEALEKFNDNLGIDVSSKDIVILGGSIVGRQLSRLLSVDSKKRYVRLIEKNQDTCVELSKSLNGVVIINGDFTDPDLQSSEGIFKSDCLVSVSSQDDTNLLMCMSAQKYKTNKIISRYFKKEYMDIFMFTGLDTIIGFDRVVSNEIFKCVISDTKALLRLRQQEEIFFIHTVDKKSKLYDCYFGDIAIPNGLRILVIKRGNHSIFPLMDTKFLEGDKVFVFTNFTKYNDLTKIFGKNVTTDELI